MSPGRCHTINSTKDNSVVGQERKLQAGRQGSNPASTCAETLGCNLSILQLPYL